MPPDTPSSGYQAAPMRVLWHTLMVATAVWTVLLAALMYWDLRSHHGSLEGLLYLKAEMLYDNTWALHHWVGSHGGVYVEMPEDAPASPFLVQQPEHRLVTPGGRHLALVTTTVVLKGMAGDPAAQGKTRVELTSLEPLNPASQPAPWQREGLEALVSGRPEWVESMDANGQAYRFMRPIYLQQMCLDCHEYADAELGDVVGAISVHLDAGDDVAVYASSGRVMLLSYGAIWLVGLTGLGFTGRHWAGLLRILKLAATRDPLTGLWNRGELKHRLAHEIARAERYGHPLAVLMLDIDHFKRVNDTHGHQAGDLVLKTLAELIQGVVRGSDLVARYGGEEILIICPETDAGVAWQLAERIRREVAEATIQVPPSRIRVTVSLGVAAYPGLPAGTDLIHAADEAMYRAKESGRNRVCSASGD